MIRQAFSAVLLVAAASGPASAQFNDLNKPLFDKTKMVSSSNFHPEVAANLDDASHLMAAGKWSEAATAAQKAQASASSDYDKLQVDRILGQIYLKLDDAEDAALAAEAAAELPGLPGEEKVDVYANAAALAHNAGHTDKAVKYAMVLKALNPTDTDSRHIIAVVLPAP